MLLVLLEQLSAVNAGIAAEAVFALVDARGHHHNVLLGDIRVVQQVIEVVKIARIADGHQHVAGTHVHLLAVDQRLLGDAELLAHLVIGAALLVGDLLGNREDAEQEEREADPGNRRQWLGHQVDQRGGEQQQRNQRQSDRNLQLADGDIARHAELAIARFGEAQHKHRQGLESKAPDHAEGIQRRQQIHVAAAERQS